MSSIACSAVSIQTSPQSVPSTPSWLGEVAVVARYLSHLDLFEKIALEVRFSRRRFGIYDVIDFVAGFFCPCLRGEAPHQTFFTSVARFLPAVLFPLVAAGDRTTRRARS